ncbi:hypothetical protein [Spirillospora sp. NBC_01491]|uniref:hypothetical protein n=1 Tax=Spirillospora sp. NBC_01491 TaxID=2976007 RepID=UPI002E35B6DB|nr:hypothetical protein [Spirillospora sp. NBC_01491]
MGIRPRGQAEHRTAQASPATTRKRAPETAIPQSERIASLTGLAQEFDRTPGILTAFTVINNYVALDVIPTKAPEWAVTIGIIYFKGTWWFIYLHNGRTIGSTSHPSIAAHQIKTQWERRQRDEPDHFGISPQNTRPHRGGQRHDLR